MKRIIAKWFMSREMDSHRAIPSWVRRWIDQDDGLQKHRVMLHQLEARLKSDAHRISKRQVDSERHAFEPAHDHSSVLLANRALVIGGSLVAIAASLALFFYLSQPSRSRGASISEQPIHDAAPRDSVTSQQQGLVLNGLALALERGTRAVHQAARIDPQQQLIRRVRKDLPFHLTAATGETGAILAKLREATAESAKLEAKHMLSDIRMGTHFLVNKVPGRLIALTKN